jgi:DNA-binding NtrC family response regulator
VDSALLAAGDAVELRGHYVLLFTMRPATLEVGCAVAHPFGERDAHGILGESPAAWALRDAIAFAAKSTLHVLLRGQSGTGKELAARAIHELSARARRRLVARNAATFPPTLIDAELFGNVKNFPNPGVPDREGLVGEAHGGTLFLDEVGELHEEMQAHLLRLLDSGGEYHRLGESKARHADIRLIAATNRPALVIKHDLLARITLVIELPSLDERREDIPLLARHLVLRAARENPVIAERFVRRVAGGRDEANLDAALVVALLRHSYTTNVRELDKLLWRSMAAATLDHTLKTPDDLRASRPLSPASVAEAMVEEPDVDELLAGLVAKPSEQAVRETMLRHRGKVRKAADELGITHWSLMRLLKKYGIRRS